MRHWYSVIYEAITIQISLIGLAKESLFKISPPFSAVIIQVYSGKHQKWHSVMLMSSRAELSSNATSAITWGKYNPRIYRTFEVVSIYCQVRITLVYRPKDWWRKVLQSLRVWHTAYSETLHIAEHGFKVVSHDLLNVKYEWEIKVKWE